MPAARTATDKWRGDLSQPVSETPARHQAEATPLWNMEDSMTTYRTTVRRNVVVALIAAVVSIPLSGQGPTGSANRAGAGSTNRSAVAPRFDLVKRSVDEAYARYRSDTSGKNADYIPYLAQVDSKLFGIAAVSTDNQSYSVGDTSYSFSMQSISKIFTLALALEELGADKVFDRIGNEPTGRPFNSVEAVVDMQDAHGKSAG